MEIVDLSKAVRRRKDCRRHEMRRVSGDANGLLARIAKLQHTLEVQAKTGNEKGFLKGRRELFDLIFTAVSEDVGAKRN